MQTQQRIAVISSVVALVTILAGSVAVLSLFISSPRDIGPIGVTVWFFVSFVFLGGVITLGSYYHKRKRIESKSQLGSIFKGSLRGGFLLAGLVIILLALQSLRLLSLGDAILLILITLVTELYFRTKKQ